MIRRILPAVVLSFLTCTGLLQAQDAEFVKTVRLIQHKINCCSVPFSPSVKRKVDSISVVMNGEVTFYYSDGKPPLTFNLLKLYKERGGGTGMDTIMNGKYIQFYLNPDKINLIRFATAADAKEAYSAFRELRLKMNDRDPAAIYFIKRTTVLRSENEMLLNSIRCIDKMKAGDTVVNIKSRGEGWLDKDSLPVGQWSFYAEDDKGKEYLLKSGTYSRTVPAMFEVRDIDSSELSDRYHLSFCTLQEDHARNIPFIKSYSWNYYHPDGRLWRSVNYLVSQIPIWTSIMITGSEEYPSSTLAVMLKENPDEWTTEDQSSHDF